MKLKYAVYPGPVKSKNDGQVHFIGAAQLMALYRVHPQECLVIHNATSIGEALENGRKERLADEHRLIRLFPDFTGAYTIPKA